MSTDVHDLDTDSIYYRSNGISHSVRFIQPGSDSPGLPDISEVPENTEVDCSLPEPHSSSSTSTLSGGTDFIFISDEDSGSNEQSSDRYANIYCKCDSQNVMKMFAKKWKVVGFGLITLTYMSTYILLTGCTQQIPKS